MRELDTMSQDHIVMQEGRVMIMRHGEMKPIEEKMTLPDGTRIMPDGTMMNPDGTTRMMVEGETILV